MDWLLSLGFFALAGIGGALLYWRRHPDGSGSPVWVIAWLGLALIDTYFLTHTGLFEVFSGCVALGLGGGWAISRLRNRAARITGLCIWIAMPVAAFLSYFYPRDPGPHMFGFAVILFIPVLLGWAVATLLGATFTPRAAPRS